MLLPSHRHYTFILLGALLLAKTSMAQPTDADVRKQLTNSGTKTIKFSKSTGTRQWNSDVGNWEWVRGVEIVRASEFPGIDLVVIGDAVYQNTGPNKYSYWKFRVASNEYLGIPNPTEKEVLDFVGKDWAKFYGFYFQKITKLHSGPTLAAKPGWTWHSPNSVSFKMKLKFDHIISNTEVETVDTLWEVRLYRDDPKAPWKNMLAHRDQEAAATTVVGKQTFTMEQVRDLEKKTLGNTFNEQSAKAAVASLPAVNVPEFSDAEEVVKHLHNVLRNGTGPQFKATMLKLLASSFFIDGSQVQLRADIEKSIDDAIVAAYGNKATYKQMYCQNPVYRVEKWGTDPRKKSVYIGGAIDKMNSYFIVAPVNAGYKDGVPQAKLRIVEWGTSVRQDDDAIAFVNSFSDRKKLCKND